MSACIVTVAFDHGGGKGTSVMYDLGVVEFMADDPRETTRAMLRRCLHDSPPMLIAYDETAFMDEDMIDSLLTSLGPRLNETIAWKSRQRYEMTLWITAETAEDAGQLVSDALADLRDEHNVDVGSVRPFSVEHQKGAS